MRNIKKVLVIGGGFSGMAAAIRFSQAGCDVDLVEINEHWTVAGAGITVSGPTLRVLDDLGLLSKFMERGWTSDKVALYGPDSQLSAELTTKRLRPNVPGVGGILRPVLARIFADATLEANVNVRLGVTFSDMKKEKEVVNVTFTDGNQSAYDLVVGADGLYSKVREFIFKDAAKPKFTGQGCWRAVVPRPSGITGPSMFMGPQSKAGVNPVSNDEMYLFYVQHLPDNPFITPDSFLEKFTDALKGFSGVIGDIRDNALQRPDARLNYRPLEGLMLAEPWHQGRVVLIGDAVHATTPHLASGAAIGIEDAMVLSEEVMKHSNVEEALSQFSKRRFDRCKLVVDNSRKLGELEIAGDPKNEHPKLMESSIKALMAEI